MNKLIYILLLFTSFVNAQCLYIDAGIDVSLPCSTNCTTLTANYLETYQTTSYSVTSIPYIPYSYTAGTLYNIPIDDRWSPILTLPFEFCFFNQVFTQYVFSTNGVISFNLTYANATSPWAFSASIPTNAALFPRSMIGLFHDIDPSIGGTVRYGIQGNYPCRKLVISYFNIPHFQCNTQKSTFQIVLHEFTNIIEIFVEKKQTCVPWNGGRACLGIQNNAGTLAAFPIGRNTSVYTIYNTPEAWRFTPNGPVNSVFTWLDNSGNFISSLQTINVCTQVNTSYVAQVSYNCGNELVTLKDTINITTNGVLLPLITTD